MNDKPKISIEAERLIDAALRARGEESVDAMYALHRYIKKLENAASPLTPERDRDRNPQGEDAKQLRAEHESPVPKAIAQEVSRSRLSEERQEP